MRTHTTEKTSSSNTYIIGFIWSCPLLLSHHKCGGESSQLHELSTSLDQEAPKTPNIKEEQEEVWTSQEGNQLLELEEADTNVNVKSEDDDAVNQEGPEPPHIKEEQEEVRNTMFTFIPVSVKSEDDDDMD